MCDGVKEEIIWTIRVRSTGKPFVNADGYGFVFDDEDAAEKFVANRREASALEIVAIRG